MNVIETPTKNPYHLPREYLGMQGESWLSYPEMLAILEQAPTNGLFIEVGTASGVTASLIAIEKTNLLIHCLDTFVPAETGSPESFANRVAQRKLHWKNNCKPNMQLFEMTLEEYLSLPSHGDLRPVHVFIDADHSYSGVKKDLNSISEIEPDFIYCHDYGDSTWVGVKQAVDEFCQSSRYRITSLTHSLATLSIRD